MKTTFHPNDLRQLDGMVDGVIPNGSAFIITAAGEKIYAPSRVVETLNIQPGDGLRCWCVPNDPEFGNDTQYKAIRAIITHRLVEAGAEPKNRAAAMATVVSDAVVVAEAPKATALAPIPEVPAELDGEALRAEIEEIIDTAKVYSAREVYVLICKKYPAMWKDAKLSKKVSNALLLMAGDGTVACAKLYADTKQAMASTVYYARTVELIIMHMKGEVA